MHTKRNNIYRQQMGSAFLFLMAALVLVISCPLKRLLADSFNAQTSLFAKPGSANNVKSLNSSTAATVTCTVVEHGPANLKADANQSIKIVEPVFTANVFDYTGYFIHSFLDGIKVAANTTPASQYTSLSLFLQHRSLLI